MARAMITGACCGLMFQSIASLIALVCTASAVTDELHNANDFPGSCSDDAVHLLQSQIITAELDARTENTDADVISHPSQVRFDSYKDGNKVPIGTCIRPADKSQVEYHSWALLDPGDGGGGPARKQIFEFDPGPWLPAYNPSIVELPNSLKQGAAKFAMTFRHDINQCHKVVKKAPVNFIAKVRQDASRNEDASRNDPHLLILDANFCLLSASTLNVSGRATNVTEDEDVRLLVEDGNLFASFVMWTKGHWLAPIKMWHDPFQASLDLAQGIKLGGTDDKNYGLFWYQSRLMALRHVFKKREVPPTKTLSLLELHGEKGNWHNSANLLPLQDGSGEFLGIMHMHTDPVNRAKSGRNSFWYGSGYTQRFFKLSAKPSFVIQAVGEQFCLQREDGKCESVQMVMSMMQTAKDEILVSYGVNDCEARFASFSIASILEQMSSVPDGGRAADVMQVRLDPALSVW